MTPTRLNQTTYLTDSCAWSVTLDKINVIFSARISEFLIITRFGKTCIKLRFIIIIKK